MIYMSNVATGLVVRYRQCFYIGPLFKKCFLLTKKSAIFNIRNELLQTDSGGPFGWSHSACIEGMKSLQDLQTSKKNYAQNTVLTPISQLKCLWEVFHSRLIFPTAKAHLTTHDSYCCCNWLKTKSKLLYICVYLCPKIVWTKSQST